MLQSLSIRDVVLIDRLDLDCRDGLTVLTGETGAGKSILLDSLGLALGRRSESGLVRAGATQASVTACFDVDAAHPVAATLKTHGLDLEQDGSGLVLRRVLGADGRSRGFVNDTPVNVRLMREIADQLVEVEGQFEAQGLLDPRTHRDLLDAFAENGQHAATVAAAWRAWRDAESALDERRDRAARLAEQQSQLEEAIAELERLAPQPGEAAALAVEREVLMHQEQIIAAFNEALAMVEGEDMAPGVLDRLRSAQSRLDRIVDKAGPHLQAVLEALDRAMIETEEAVAGLQGFGSRLEAEPDRLERVDDRLYALRTLGRKHEVAPDDLAAHAERLRVDLAELEGRGEALARMEAQVAGARSAFADACATLTARRREAAGLLAARVMEELPALKLERAVFAVELAPRVASDWSADGAEDVRFIAATNPGMPAGPISRIASGGELSRFMLALSLVLARASAVRTLVFDEVDSGVGGATAAAVGERLAELARAVQVLVVTHSPQVAARGDQHWRVLKRERDGVVATTVEALEGEARLEEVARMLSGAEVTAEARGAAARLLEAAA